MVGKVVRSDRAKIEFEQDLVLNAQFLLLDVMSEKGVSKAELARRAGISRSRLSQVLRAEANPTLRTLAHLFFALGENVDLRRVSFEPVLNVEEVKWGADNGDEIRSVKITKFDKNTVAHLNKIYGNKNDVQKEMNVSCDAKNFSPHYRSDRVA